ncbi:MAG: hypothetical protein IKM61_10390 [Eubacteriaceae bacterium]|nr:hypothetical protein [Eubacteriaceae bacterium]
MKKIKDRLICLLIAVFVFGVAIVSFVLPDGEYSVSERRPLAQMPDITIKNILSGKFMKDYEDYTIDQFPMRDAFREIKAFTEINLLGKKDNNGLYEYEGYLAEMQYPLDSDSIENAAAKFGAIYKNYLGGSEGRIYLSIIPDKNYFIGESSGHLCLDYSLLASSLSDKMPYAEYIDIFPYLGIEDFYLTDTHWRQENIVDVAENISAALGVDIPGDYTEVLSDEPFYGVYASQYALNKESDRIAYLTNDIINSLEVYDHENGKDIPVYNTSAITGKDPYELYLGGPLSLVSIKNPSVTNGRSLIVFRDSFASSLMPLICQGYEEVTLIDIRYISSQVISNFVEFDGQDVLFMYSAMVINNSETLR